MKKALCSIGFVFGICLAGGGLDVPNLSFVQQTAVSLLGIVIFATSCLAVNNEI